MASLSHDSQRLLVAYVNKERAAQQADNQLLLQIERDKEQAIADKVGHIYGLRVAWLASRIRETPSLQPLRLVLSTGYIFGYVCYLWYVRGSIDVEGIFFEP